MSPPLALSACSGCCSDNPAAAVFAQHHYNQNPQQRREILRVVIPAGLTGYFRNRNMIEIEKSDCTDCITVGCNHTGRWREKMASKFPTDPRNAKAAACLLKLACEAAELSDADWLRLLPHCGGWADERFREGISKTARLVGFKHKIKDLPTFVQYLLDVLSQPVAA